MVELYNQRGASERTFDIQYIDFGWKHLPFSFMKGNIVFMVLTALIRNFFVWLLGKITANNAFGLEATSREKKSSSVSSMCRSDGPSAAVTDTCRPYNQLRL